MTETRPADKPVVQQPQLDHTPGPWVALKGKDNADTDANYDDRDIWGSVITADFEWYIARIWHEGHLPGEANARLMAAAPTMHDYIAKRAAEGDTAAVKILEVITGTTER